MSGAVPPASFGAGPSGVRLAELVGTLSLAVDLGLGQPMGHVARSCLLAGRLAEHMQLDERSRASLYYVTLLGWVGCIADSYQVARTFGDDLDYRAGVYDVDMKPLPFLGYLLQRAGADGPAYRRITSQAALVATGARSTQDSLRAHCQVTSAIARRLGLGVEVDEPLHQIFARWDGKGLPRGLRGSDIALPVRLWHVADVAEVHHRSVGLRGALDVLQARSGTQFDPDVVAAFRACAENLFADLPDGAGWQDVVAVEPALHTELSEAELDRALEAVADYADLKSWCFGGHSRGVADLAAAAGRRLGLRPREVRVLRRAGLVHDLGRAGVPNTIWDKSEPLTAAESERVRLHSYYTDRMLARPGPIGEFGAVAALAHERLDGSGYHRGLHATDIPLPGRVLAAADRFHTMIEARPHRQRMNAADAAERLHTESAEGRLDPAAVDAVLAAAGQRVRRQPEPAGLSPREVEVLVLLARGASNRQIARRLGITTKTAGNHIEHIYAKADVGTRAAATLFAMRHGLLASLAPLD